MVEKSHLRPLSFYYCQSFLNGLHMKTPQFIKDSIYLIIHAKIDYVNVLFIAGFVSEFHKKRFSNGTSMF